MFQFNRTLVLPGKNAALLFLLIVGAAALSGCAGGMLKGSAADRATVYIFRSPGAMPGDYPTPVLVDGKQIGRLVSNGYLMVRLDVGEHVISSPAKNKPQLSIYAAKGLTYYVSQEVIPAHPPFILINRVKESIGQPYVAHGHRIY